MPLLAVHDVSVTFPVRVRPATAALDSVALRIAVIAIGLHALVRRAERILVPWHGKV